MNEEYVSRIAEICDDVNENIVDGTQMRNDCKRQWILTVLLVVIRLSLGAAFLAASLPKLRQPYDFLSDVYAYELLSPKVGLIVGMLLPWGELLLGLCLIGDLFISGALMLSITFGVVFTFAQVSALRHGLNINCGCFGSSATEHSAVNHTSLLRAWGILLAAITGCWVDYAKGVNKSMAKILEG